VAVVGAKLEVYNGSELVEMVEVDDLGLGRRYMFGFGAPPRATQ
jgi:hypothetical protein